MQQFTATISIALILTREEVEYLAVCATNHHDATVNALVPPGPGATINGMRFGLIDPAATQVEREYKFGEIGLLYEAVEFQDDPIAVRLQKRFRLALEHINSMSESINGALSGLAPFPLD